MTDEEALFVIVGVDEPTCDAFCIVTTHFASARVKNIHAIDLDLYLIVFGVDDVDVRFPKDDEQIALAGIFEVVSHVQVGVHACLKHRDTTELMEL